MEKRLITSALPYVNNIPHLGNLIQVLSADVFSRYCRLKGYDTLYICGTDEYGTATETRAKEEGISPRELCDRYFSVHDDIYKWFNIAFDRFGRTSTPNHTKITRDIFRRLDEKGYIRERTIEQLFCQECRMFLADRYVHGICPHCGYEQARGDQCEDCGKLLDPTELKNPRCGTCGAVPIIRKTDHLYLDLQAILPKLQRWMERASRDGAWAKNAVRMTQAWIRDGLRERCITRDLQWGIPVPREGYEDKVFYVWFDAPIGYISITANHTDDWQAWWQNPEGVRLYQFVGKDNIPFHTVIFPSSLLGSYDNWTLLHHISSSEYLNYETGKFSKSKGIGVFGTDAKDTGIPVDVWRFYIFYNRPETADTQFTWKDFQEKVNGELIGNLSNLVNRTLTFVHRYYEGRLPEEFPAGSEERLSRAGQARAAFRRAMEKIEQVISESLERVELRNAFRRIFELSSIGNKYFQDGEPWKSVKEDRAGTALLLHDLVALIRDLAILISPYLPGTGHRIAEVLGIRNLDWENLAGPFKPERIKKPDLLFEKLEDKRIEELKLRFSGDQMQREGPAFNFRSKVDLRVARIERVERHPKADKLYIETINLGSEERQIVSGLVPFYSEDELVGRNILLVRNLKPAKLRGVVSQGMLLAAESGNIVEVVFADNANPGDRVFLKGDESRESDEFGESFEEPQPEQITIDDFFEIPILVENYTISVDGRPLTVGGKAVRVREVENGKVR